MDVFEFIHALNWTDLPAEVRRAARRCLLDTLGAAIGGRCTPMAQIIHDFAAEVYAGRGAALWLDGREVSPPGAALANAITIDSLDIHDGHSLTKGHAGAAVVPAALATLALDPQGVVSGRELLTTLVVGYEIALRAGVALHATSPDYHTSGAWNALGAAAVLARRLHLSTEQTRHALGIAEYYGPRSPMMRCIDYPTMVKDGSGWGAMGGLSGALLARRGFTGAPALTVEGASVAKLWADLGRGWRMLEQYLKPHAVCRWAQPAVEGALALRRGHKLQPAEIRRLRVTTFYPAVRLQVRRPATTEAAQYSLAFPVAAALVYGHLGPDALTGAALVNPDVLRLADLIEIEEDPGLSERFPAQRRAVVSIETDSDERLDSGEVGPPWEADDPPTDQELFEKFRWLARGASLSAQRVEAMEVAAWNCAELADAGDLAALLNLPVGRQ